MPTSTTKRKPEELRTYYGLYPKFRDVVVEGRDDAAWLRWYLADHQFDDCRVVAVDDLVDLPSTVVTSHGHMDNGNRARVYTLSQIAAEWRLSETSLTCIIDSDFEIFEETVETEGLLKTDFAAMEVYALGSRPLAKFLGLVKAVQSGPDVIKALLPLWHMLFVLRYVAPREVPGSRMVNGFERHGKACTGEDPSRWRPLLKAIHPIPNKEDCERILGACCTYFERISTDSLQGIRGHDIAPVLIEHLGLKNHQRDQSVVEQLMRSCVEARDLDEFPMFKELRLRVSSV